MSKSPWKAGDTVLVVERSPIGFSGYRRVRYTSTTIRKVHANGNVYLASEPAKQIAWRDVIADTKDARIELDVEAGIGRDFVRMMNAAEALKQLVSTVAGTRDVRMFAPLAATFDGWIETLKKETSK